MPERPKCRGFSKTRKDKVSIGWHNIFLNTFYVRTLVWGNPPVMILKKGFLSIFGHKGVFYCNSNCALFFNNVCFHLRNHETITNYKF